MRALTAPALRCLAIGAAVFASGSACLAATPVPAARTYREKIEPLLSKYCYDCHGNGVQKGKVAFDEFATDADLLARRDLWLAVLKNVRAGVMPPREEGAERPTEAEVNTLAHWIKYEAFGLDPANPDPGLVTVRRLNRVEYRNTIRDLVGIDFNSEAEFPPDDTGNGFDNNGDVLTISPLLLEKYLAAAETIIDQAVPKVSKVLRVRRASGREFQAKGGGSGENMSAKRATTVARTFSVDRADRYRISAELEVRGSFDFDPARCRIVCRVDGEEKFTKEVGWAERKLLKHEVELDWAPGNHVVSFEVQPLAPAAVPSVDGAKVAADASSRTTGNPGQREGVRAPGTSVSVRIAAVEVKGPLNPEHWAAPENHARFFPKGPAPADPAARDAYARELLGTFARRAFRRPVDDAKLTQLVDFARHMYEQPGRTFEQGIGHAMMAVLGSPRFLFRIESVEPGAAGAFANLDEYALASRLSYFLWSTMPDEELSRLADRGELRANLKGQVARMLQDPRSQAFVRNFTGQWLQARDVESVPINTRSIFGREGPSALRNREGRLDFDSAFRKLLRSETELYFDYVVKQDRSVLELIDSDYTFLNEKLASFYGVPGVQGDQLRRVTLPPDSPRGGILTQGTTLTVTSNPTRTSPVKRGFFILENILGTPPPPAPPNVPDLEESKKEFGGREPKLSEMLAVHRSNKLCSSCHQRMDPLGLAMENFNAVGAWRTTEAGQPIEPAGELITGEKFGDVRELKRVLRTERKSDVYRCLTEKMLTYALGRGLDYHDAHTLDVIVERLEREEGRMSALLHGIIESAAFQKRRTNAAAAPSLSFHPPSVPTVSSP